MVARTLAYSVGSLNRELVTELSTIQGTIDVKATEEQIRQKQLAEAKANPVVAELLEKLNQLTIWLSSRQD